MIAKIEGQRRERAGIKEHLKRERERESGDVGALQEKTWCKGILRERERRERGQWSV